MFPKGYTALWSCPPISASTTRRPANSSAPRSSPKKAPMSATWRAVPPCLRQQPIACRGRRTDCAITPKSNMQPSKTGTQATLKRAKGVFTTSSPNAGAAPGLTPRSLGPRSKSARRSHGNIRAASYRAIIVGEFYSVALTNAHMQADTGTKMIHLGKNQLDDRV